MKIKVLALTFSLIFFTSITATSFAQVVSSTTAITVVDDDDDKKNKKKSSTKECKDASDKSCKTTKKSCCSSKGLKGDSCKDKKSTTETKSDKDKR